MKTHSMTHSRLTLTLLTGLAVLSVACGGEDSELSSQQTQKRLVQRVYDEAYSGGDISVIDELLAPDYVNHQVFPGLSSDREGLKQVIGAMRTAFPDLNIVISDMNAEGDKVYVHATIHGTHLGPLNGMEATGKKVAFETIDSFRLVNGKQMEHWGVTDQLGLMMQLGVMSGG